MKVRTHLSSHSRQSDDFFGLYLLYLRAIVTLVTHVEGKFVV